jgi:hypothetical protein
MTIIYFEKYTEKSVVVRGETKDFKDELKSIGGKWNSRLLDKSTQEHFGGWIFPSSKEGEVKKWVSVKNSVSQSPSTIPSTIPSQNNLQIIRSQICRINRIETMLSEVVTELRKLEHSYLNEPNVNSDVESEYEGESDGGESGPPPKRLLGKK